MAESGHNSDDMPGGEMFPTTHWSVVLNAAQAGSPQADAALARLCETYWFILTGEPITPSYAAVAVELGITPEALRMAAHRLRRRFRTLLQEEVALTVATPEDVDDEIRRLLDALSE